MTGRFHYTIVSLSGYNVGAVTFFSLTSPHRTSTADGLADRLCRTGQAKHLRTCSDVRVLAATMSMAILLQKHFAQRHHQPRKAGVVVHMRKLRYHKPQNWHVWTVIHIAADWRPVDAHAVRYQHCSHPRALHASRQSVQPGGCTQEPHVTPTRIKCVSPGLDL